MRYRPLCRAFFISTLYVHNHEYEDSVSPTMSGFLHFYEYPSRRRIVSIVSPTMSSFLHFYGTKDLKRYSCYVSPTMSGFLHFYSSSGNPVKSRAPEVVCGAKLYSVVKVYSRTIKMGLSRVLIRCGAKHYLTT